MTLIHWSLWVALLLRASSGWAQGQVAVRPQVATLLPGATCAFQVQALEGGAADRDGSIPLEAEAWTWTLLEGGVGSLDPATGLYLAPEVAEPALVKVLASCPAVPGLGAQATLLVLPHEPFDLVGKVLGQDWLCPFSSELPFWNRATKRRNGEGHEIRDWHLGWEALPWTQYGGYGIPFTLRWPAPEEALASLLTWSEGEEVTQLDVSGKEGLELTRRSPLEQVRVESLKRAPGSPHLWMSQWVSLPVHLRGMAPLLGGEPGHADGKGLGARFREPFGLALVEERRSGFTSDSGCLVTDPQSHVIRLVSSRGEVSTPWGQPGQAGHLDSRPPALRRLVSALCLDRLLGPPQRVSLFNGPTFLTKSPWLSSGNGGWRRCLVADSGNHVIRALHSDGTVETVAGVPGVAGYRDALRASEALFDNPLGLAEDGHGNVYIADQGNRVIRWLTPRGEVRTVAGGPGEAGATDGPRGAARFTDLQGLALDGAYSYRLYAVDGHAIRLIILPEGEVSTVLGVVTEPGFQEVPEGSPAGRLREPCLNRPCGLCVAGGTVKIADRGNHCLREWSPVRQTLATLVGDPALGQTRWGLLRDGVEPAQDERYAALEAPRTVAAGQRGEYLLVSTGRALAVVTPGLGQRDSLLPLVLECPSAEVAGPCSLWFLAETLTPEGASSLRTIHYTVDLLEPDGTLATRLRGATRSSMPVTLQGQFSQRGWGRVILRCATDQGLSAGAQVTVQVR